MEIKYRKVIEDGTASTVKADDLIPQYTEAVAKFLRDNSSLGEAWQKDVASKLYNFQGKNKEGDLLGSSPYMLTAISTFCPQILLIGGKTLLELYKQAGNKNPFGQVYIDFGVQLNGKSQTNSAQFDALFESYKQHGITQKTGEVLVPDFAQLRLVADEKAGLVFKLIGGVKQSDLATASDYPFRKGYVGNNGLFGVYLVRGDGWCAGDDSLAGSDDYGRVVRFDAEGGEAPKKLAVKKDLVSDLSAEFAKRF